MGTEKYWLDTSSDGGNRHLSQKPPSRIVEDLGTSEGRPNTECGSERRGIHPETCTLP